MSLGPIFHRKSDVSDHQPPNAPFYEWNSSSNSIKIRLDLATARRLGLVVQEGFEALPTRGLEVGGLLLGRFIPEDGPITAIEDFDPLESEHRHGPSYTLSEKDRKLLESRLSAQAVTRGLGVVGYWRSHTRPGLYLDQEDYSTIRTYFTNSSHVFLLVKPSAARQSVGGFFFWENGDIRRESPYEEFLLNGPVAGRRSTSSPAGLAAGACGPARPGWPSRDPASVENRAGPSNRPDLPSASAPVAHREPVRPVWGGPEELPTAENPPGLRDAARTALWRFRLRASRWIWLASAILLLAIFIVCSLVIRSVSSPAATAAITQPAPTSTIQQPSHARPSMFSEFSLNVEPTANSLRLWWNRDSQIIQNAPAGLLWITDGARHLQLDLDKRLLSNGSIVYVPTEGDVEFELEVPANGRLVSESVRALVPTHTPPVAAAKLAPAPPPSADQTGEPPEPQQLQKTARMPRPRATSTPGESVARADVKPFQPPPPEPVFSGGSPVDTLAPPPVLASTPIDAAAKLPAGKLYDTATITYEPVRQPALQRVLQKFPGLRRLQRPEEGDGKEFVPPKPRRELAFLVPDSTGREAAFRKPVNLKISLDESGKVTRVEPLSNGPMAGVAAHAALAWQFTPARWKDKPVASEVLVHLRFDGDPRSTAASAVRNSAPASAPRN